MFQASRVYLSAGRRAHILHSEAFVAERVRRVAPAGGGDEAAGIQLHASALHTDAAAEIAAGVPGHCDEGLTQEWLFGFCIFCSFLS